MTSKKGNSLIARRKLSTAEEKKAWRSLDGLMENGCWSIYSVYDKMDQVAVQGTFKFVYLKEDYWAQDDKGMICDGPRDIIVDLPANPTWRQIAEACDTILGQCTDRHHIFVENILYVTYNGELCLTMQNGS